MERSTVWWIVGFATSVTGIVLAGGSVRLLGRARAAANWPSAPPAGLTGRTGGITGTAFGLVLLAAGAAALTARLTPPVRALSWLVPVGAGAVVLLAGAIIAAKVAERAELTALIRTPPAAKWIPAQDREPGAPAGPAQNLIPVQEVSTDTGGTDPAVPSEGQPGWVYCDPDGDWYLAVSAAPEGHRLVRLTDFALVPPGAVGAPLELAGSVQISVYPTVDAPPPPVSETADQA
jgi:hypothetical protein